MRQFDDLAKPSGHEREIARFFRDHTAFEGAEPIFDTPLYLLGFFNRSGSNLLSEFLNSTPVFAGFREELNSNIVVQAAGRSAIASFPEYIIQCSDAARSAGRVYGFKASWAQIAMLLRFKIDRMYPSVRILHMTRRDVLAQAISYSVAFQSKQWTSKMSRAVAEPVFDARQIQKFMEAALFSEQAITWIANIRAIPRHRVVYEDLVEAPVETIQEIARFAGFELADWKPGTPKLAKQATELNAVFRERYLEHACTKLNLPRGAESR